MNRLSAIQPYDLTTPDGVSFPLTPEPTVVEILISGPQGPAHVPEHRSDTFGPGYHELEIPAGYSGVDIQLLGAGGGGGSGSRRAFSGIRTGGGGGGGGNTAILRLNVVDLGGAGAILPISVGNGGEGAAAVTTDTTNGTAGVQGGTTGIGTVMRAAAWPRPTPNAMNGIANNGTVLVVVGAGGLIFSSTDGETWTARASGTVQALNCVIWVGGIGLFVAVGAGGTILTSPDSITWTARVSGVAAALNGIVAYGGVLVAVGASGAILTSADAVTWTANAYVSAATFNQVTAGNGLCLAVDSLGQAVRAIDPAGAWTAVQVTPTTTQAMNGVAYGAGIYVAGAAVNGKCFTSPDGIVWTDRGPRFQRYQLPVTFINGWFFDGRNISQDGLVWRQMLHGGRDARYVTFFHGAWFMAMQDFFVGRLDRIVTAFTPANIMGSYGGNGGTTGVAGGGASDGLGILPGTPGAASAIAGSAPLPGNAVASAGGGAGGGATAANVSITASLGGEGSISTNFLLQGFNGVSGGVGPISGGSAGDDLTLFGSSGGGGGAWTTGAPGQNGADGGNPGGGGGGGGASDNGFVSGAGGKGGDGQIRLIWF